MTKTSPNAKRISEIVRAALLECFPHLPSKFESGNVMALFESRKAEAIKQEIVDVGKKLWIREYVDGNGGNISYRMSQEYVLCTPTMCSKADLTVNDICLVSLENKRIIGTRDHTSEILLHLEIYKAVPEAMAIIHCHPPHATAYAITGLVPLGEIVPEQEVFVGPIATAPYDTPGTKAFAETVLPFIHSHNTILLENHGVVCWADTVTHAEWCVEVLETYCRTLILAAQLGSPIRRIPPEKIAGLLEIKRQLNLPDARFPVLQQSLASGSPANKQVKESKSQLNEAFDSLVSSITDQVIQFVSDEEK